MLWLYAELAGIHRWGHEMTKAMTDEERRRFWIDRWERAGLRRDVLEALYDAVKPMVRALVERRRVQRLRFLRSRLRLGR